MAPEQIVRGFEIHDQPNLGMSRIGRLTWTGIRYRLFRSFISVVVIGVAVAFFMNILSSSLLRRSISRQVAHRIWQMRLAARWSARLSQAGTIDSLLRELTANEAEAPIMREIARFGGLSAAELEALRGEARTARIYQRYFNRLDYGRRRALVRETGGVEIFDKLGEPAAWDRFVETMNTLRLPPFPTELEAFETFLRAWPGTRRRLQRVIDGRQRAVERIAAALGDASLIERLTEADGAFGETVRVAGFAFPPETAAAVAAQALAVRRARVLLETFALRAVRRDLAAKLNAHPNDLTPSMFWRFLRDEDNATWCLQRIAQEKRYADFVVPPPEVVALAERKLEEQLLGRVERFNVATEDEMFGLSSRMLWLMFISMLVCAVGITNAMLMAVTERFREIATLKCLGALDGSIMGMFVTEACLFGLIGGLAGALIGGMIGLFMSLLTFGSLIFEALPLGDLLVGTIGAMALGVVLAAVGAIYPSFKAARLAPMEAMRIE